MSIVLARSPRPPLTTTDAAIYTGQAASTLNKLRVYGGGPRFIKFGKSVRYDPDDLDAWIDSRKRSSTSEQATEAA
jgi:predicted DNA-binding transcriptional regulator AlpA